MKGVILAGGSGSRLSPSTNSVNKHLLTVYDKPIIYYPLSVLMLEGITKILIITTKGDKSRFNKLLGDGSSLGISIKYKEQTNPNGVVEFDSNKNAISIEEKPNSPKSDFAVTFLFIYDNKVINIAKKLHFSKRGELEITDVNNIYLENNQLKVQLLRRGFTWINAGTHEALFEAGTFTKKYLLHDRPYLVKNNKVPDFLDCNQTSSFNDSLKKIVEWYV